MNWTELAEKIRSRFGFCNLVITPIDQISIIINLQVSEGRLAWHQIIINEQINHFKPSNYQDIRVELFPNKRAFGVFLEPGMDVEAEIVRKIHEKKL